MRTINTIIIHCSDTPEGRDDTAQDIRSWHLQRGFKDIGYHYVIRLDGTIEQGRPITKVGAHCTGHNANSIGVCYVGGRTPATEAPAPKDTRTDAQKAAMLKLVQQLRNQYNIPATNIYGHRDFANKACPSFDVQQWVKDCNL